MTIAHATPTTATLDAATRLVTAFRDFADLQDTAATYAPKFYGAPESLAESIARRIIVAAFNEWAASVGREARAFDKVPGVSTNPRVAVWKVDHLVRRAGCTLAVAVEYLEAEEWVECQALESLLGDRRCGVHHQGDLPHLRVALPAWAGQQLRQQLQA